MWTDLVIPKISIRKLVKYLIFIILLSYVFKRIFQVDYWMPIGPFILISCLLYFIHELIHLVVGVCIAKDRGKFFVGMDFKKWFPYTVVEGIYTRNQLLLMLLAPFVIIQILLVTLAMTVEGYYEFFMSAFGMNATISVMDFYHGRYLSRYVAPTSKLRLSVTGLK